MFSLTPTSCRVCLAECLDSANDFLQFATLFDNLIKLKYFTKDVPKKVCESCVKSIFNIDNFLKTCEETETILEQCRKLKEIKLDTQQEELSFGSDILPVKDEDSDAFDVDVATEVLVIQDKPRIVDNRNNKNRKNAVRMLCCHICGQQVISSSLKHHMRTHSSKMKRNTFICDICNYTCYVKDRIRFHMRQKHLKIVRYNCEYCNRTYQDSISLKFHTSHKHTKEFSHSCSVCNKGFISAYRLANHMAKHSDLRRFNCDICGDSFKSGQYLGCHKREVHSDKTFSCKECKKIFKCMKLLRQHQQFHKPNMFNCPLCEQNFSVGQTLRSHLKRSHPELPIPPSGTNLRNLKDLDSYLSLCVS